MKANKFNKKVDWEAVEIDWRAGIKTKVQISIEHKVSRAALNKHFAKEGLGRDLTKRIEFAREIKVSADAVTSKVTSKVTPRTASIENEIVEANATMQANIILAHRKDIGRNRTLATKLLDELEAVSDNQELFEQLGELLIDLTPNENGKVDQYQQRRMEALNRALDLSSRVDSLKKLSDTLKTLIGLEREAFGIKEDVKESQSVDEFLKSLNE